MMERASLLLLDREKKGKRSAAQQGLMRVIPGGQGWVRAVSDTPSPRRYQFYLWPDIPWSVKARRLVLLCEEFVELFETHTGCIFQRADILVRQTIWIDPI